MKVGYLGPKGTFSYEACKNYCMENKEMIEYRTIPETINGLVKNEVDEVVVPIENSLQGCVTDAIDTLIENKNVNVIDEILLEIKQNLMAKEKIQYEKIEIIYSHPQAIAQCQKFIENNIPNAKIIPVESTAFAARKVKEEQNENIACICNKACMEEYGLEILSESIQDNSFNKTKFWVLSNNETHDISKNKMSMLFSVKDKPGALYNVLKIFNEYNLNLTKIESRPAKTVLGEYIFWIDVIIGNNTENEAIEKIKSEGIFVRILGKY